MSHGLNLNLVSYVREEKKETFHQILATNLAQTVQNASNVVHQDEMYICIIT